MSTLRITPLSPDLKRMKSEHFDYWQKRGFAGYKSPWIPVSKANHHLLQEGNLTIDVFGLETSHLSGRNLERVVEGKVKEVREYHTQPEFVWVDSRVTDPERFLWKNEYAELYRRYSEAVRLLLISAHLRKINIIEKVAFPLFHETNPDRAGKIMLNGIDMVAVSMRKSLSLGKGAFCACEKIKDAVGKGNFSGAVVKFDASISAHPQWVNLEALHAQGLELGRFWEIFLTRNDLFSWKIFASEVLASSVKKGYVGIFEDFQDYVPAEILYPPYS